VHEHEAGEHGLRRAFAPLVRRGSVEAAPTGPGGAHVLRALSGRGSRSLPMQTMSAEMLSVPPRALA
jgi:hypothetical protein